MENSQNTVPLAILAAGIMIAGAIYFGGAGGGSAIANPLNAVDTTSIDVAKVTSSDHVLGDINAPIMVVEYSDLECPFCKVFHQTMRDVVRDYEGQVAWTYRHFPIPQLHSKAINEAEATECATEQGGNQAFWDYTNAIFDTTNSNDSLDPAELPKIAGAIGLDVPAFQTCLSSGKYTEFIEGEAEKAVRAGATGTPYSVIVTQDGKKLVINGAESLISVKAKIDSLLK